MQYSSSRAATQRAAILDLFIRYRAVTNKHLNGVGFRYGARIHELRRQGHRIKSLRGQQGVWTYVYEGGPE